MSMDIEFGRFFNQLRNMIKKECHQPNNFIYGTIVSVDPLRIDIGGNIILEKEKLFLGQMCRPHKVTIPHTHLINPVVSEDSLAIITPSISAGTAATSLPNKISYTIKDQIETYNESDGTTTRTANDDTQTGANHDLGGAELAMNIEVKTSPVSTAVTGMATVPEDNAVSGSGSGTVTSTVDGSKFIVTDKKHNHLVPEHETLDVHFVNTDYESSVTIEIEPKLHVNDRVLMFAFNNNQMYYVAERIEQ